MKTLKIYVIEDDVWYAEIIEHYLSMNPDYEVTMFRSGAECLKKLHEKPMAITLDYRLPGENGASILAKIKEIVPDVPVILVSAQEDVATAVELLSKGAYDYIVKNDNTRDRLWNTLLRIRENQDLKNEVEALKAEVRNKYDFRKAIVGKSPSMQDLFSRMDKACKSTITVSIRGETGTGKELVAKGIHYGSDRARGQFVSINVAAIPAELIESELFGHEKGAFTGASSQRKGKFEVADKGTLFLDEVAEMDLNLQVKLLRVLQEREIVRVGGNRPTPVDIRLITATHKSLDEEVKAGRFREDLFYRLLGFPIHLPPLRERREDIPPLAQHFIQETARANGLPVKKLSQGALEKLMGYTFSGNIRELRSCIELAALISDGERIEAADINFSGLTRPLDLLQEEMSFREYKNKIVSWYLEKYNGDVYLVAEKLQLGKSTIYRIMEDL